MGYKNNLTELFDNLDRFNTLVKSIFDNGDPNFNYSCVVLMAGKQCEDILVNVIENEGIRVDEDGFIDTSSDKRYPLHKRMSILSYAASSPNLLPNEMRRIVNFIREGRNMAAHSIVMTREQAEQFMRAFNAFFTWYYCHYGIFKNDQNKRLLMYANIYNVNLISKNTSESIFPPKSVSEIEFAALSTAGISMDRIEELVTRVVRTEIHNGVSETIDVVKSEASDIKGKIDKLSELVINLSEKIGDYQSLVEKQLEMATSVEEQEHIIHAFTEECVSKMEARFEKNEADKNYRRTLNDLKDTLGDVCWDRLEARSRTFLISSKIMYEELRDLEDIIDYSGVCLLVTKALEYELSKRFYKMFLKYLKDEYGKDYSCYPSTMLRTYNGVVTTLQKHDFTLGTVAYIFCLKPDLDVEDDTTQREKDKCILLDFAEKKLYKDKSREKIEIELDSYARDIDEVKSKFRNKAAHTNELKKDNAKECFDIVLDVQKLLRRMIESFDNIEG